MATVLVRGAKGKSGNVQGIRIHIICTLHICIIYIYLYSI